MDENENTPTALLAKKISPAHVPQTGFPVLTNSRKAGNCKYNKNKPQNNVNKTTNNNDKDNSTVIDNHNSSLFDYQESRMRGIYIRRRLIAKL